MTANEHLFWNIIETGYFGEQILSAAIRAEEKLMSPEQPLPLTVSPIK